MSEKEDAKGNILIIDDTPNNLHILFKMLSDIGYQVRPATNGELALKSIQLLLPDLILLDIKMPGMDGYSVCEKLKSDEKTRMWNAQGAILDILGVENFHRGSNR